LRRPSAGGHGVRAAQLRAREEHAFIWGDFKEHALANLAQSLAICLFDFAAFLVLCVAANFYAQALSSSGLAVVAFGVVALAFLLFLMAHIYIYPMLVTFRITVLQAYKNALIFSVMKFLPNLGVLLACAALTLLTFAFFPLGILLYFLITPCLVCFIANFYAYPVLKKYMIDRVAESAEGREADEGREAGEGHEAGEGRDNG